MIVLTFQNSGQHWAQMSLETIKQVAVEPIQNEVLSRKANSCDSDN